MFHKKKVDDTQPSFSSWNQSGFSSPSEDHLSNGFDFQGSSMFLSTIPKADPEADSMKKGVPSVAFENGYAYQGKKRSIWKYVIPALLTLVLLPALLQPLIRGYRTIIRPTVEQTALFTIENDLDEDCYFYMDSRNDERDTAFLVRRGKTVAVKLPEGEYLLFYASGKRWKGVEEKFGPATEYYKADHSYKVSNDDMWTVTVYESSAGESNIEKISPNEFPNYANIE